MRFFPGAAAAAMTLAFQAGSLPLASAQGTLSPPACVPTSPPRTGAPRIPATLEPPGTVAPIVQPFADLPPNPEPPPALTQMAPVPTMVPGRTDAIDERIRELRSRLTRPAPFPGKVEPSAPAAVGTQPSASPTAPPAPGLGTGATTDLLADPPATPLGNDPTRPPAPQQSISPHAIGLDPAKTSLIPPAPPLLQETVTPNPFRTSGPGTTPPVPPVTEINSTAMSALSIPVEILRSPIDHIALADNLYAARSYGLALEAYQAAAKLSGPAAPRRWAAFQVANCHRHLGQTAEAERQYRRVAGDRDAGQFTDLAKWWLQAMEQRSQLTSQLTQLKSSLETTQETSDASRPRPAAPQP